MLGKEREVVVLAPNPKKQAILTSSPNPHIRIQKRIRKNPYYSCVFRSKQRSHTTSDPQQSITTKKINCRVLPSTLHTLWCSTVHITRTTLLLVSPHLHRRERKPAKGPQFHKKHKNNQTPARPSSHTRIPKRMYKGWRRGSPPLPPPPNQHVGPTIRVLRFTSILHAPDMPIWRRR